MPVRDDWRSVSQLIVQLEETLSKANCVPDVLLVDDHSLNRAETTTFPDSCRTIQAIRVLRLRRNLGHQRSIAIGLVALLSTKGYDAVIVMDADGEDSPAGVISLLDAFRHTNGKKAIFAQRQRRSEGVLFRCCYQVYRQLHLLLTGIEVRVGNFSILPVSYLGTLVVQSELWNHYAATIFRSRLPFDQIAIDRGRRLAGESTMNFVGLVIHGLSAISVFGDVVGVRVLIGALMGAFLGSLAIAAVAAVRLFTDLAVPGWATYMIGLITIIIIQLVSIASSFTFFILSSRVNPGFIPMRDADIFVEEMVTIYPR
jgi:polyisoprenyl-phosphate glycosyltransferase